MATNKTKPTKVSPAGFIAKLPNEQRRKDARELVAMMRRRAGSRRIGFSPRKPALVLYITNALKQKSLMSKLGKHSTGKGCLYIKTLDDVDRAVLRQLIARSLKEEPTL
jgi:hypothetical protein